MIGRLIVPIKAILTGNTSVQQIEEFEFIRNNPLISTLGAAALGGAAVHDYNTNGYHSVGNYIGDKIDSAKKLFSNGIDSTKESIHNVTKSNNEPAESTQHIAEPKLGAFQTNSFKNFNNNIINKHAEHNLPKPEMDHYNYD